MIEKLIENYYDFGDAIVLNVEYKTNIDVGFTGSEKKIDETIIFISCFNRLEDYARETIRIVFSEIQEFRHIKYSGMIMDTYFGKENGFYIVDFDPIITADENGNWANKRNLNSGFID